MKRSILAFTFLTLAVTAAYAQNWPQFRGPGATGVVEGPARPVTWDASKSTNVRWKTPIPGLSHASPVVWGDKVFVVSAVTSGAKVETRFGLYGDVAPVKDDPKHTWKLFAIDKATGKILWERIAFDGMPKVKRHPKSTHADSTPVTDGKYLVVNFSSHGLYAYDLNGKLKWKQDLGVLDAGWFYDFDYQWEYGSSPIIYKNMVIVQADIQKDSFIAAYDLKTGERVYQNRLGGTGGAFTASPVASKGKIYLASEDGDVFVVKAGPKYELLAKNPVGEVMMATPAISDGMLIVRTVSHLYAFGEKSVTDTAKKN